MKKPERQGDRQSPSVLSSVPPFYQDTYGNIYANLSIYDWLTLDPYGNLTVDTTASGLYATQDSNGNPFVQI